MAESSKREMPVAFLAGVVIVAILVAGALLWSKYASRAASVAPPALPMGAPEQAYAGEIKFSNPRMSRATNFLNQEVTYIFGTVENDGTRTVGQIELSIDFHDVSGNVVLHDTQRVFPDFTQPLAPGQTYDFQLNFEHIPDAWNIAYPAMHITGLDLK